MSAKRYRPNRIALRARIAHSLLATFLIGYALLGVSQNELVVPSRRGGAYVHGWTVIFLGIAMLSAAAVLLAVVVDHYDTRDNETSYRRIARTFQLIAWAFFVIAILSTYARSNREVSTSTGLPPSIASAARNTGDAPFDQA